MNQSFDANTLDINLTWRTIDRDKEIQKGNFAQSEKISEKRLICDKETDELGHCKPRVPALSVEILPNLIIIILLFLILTLHFDRPMYLTIALVVLLCSQIPFLPQSQWHRSQIINHMMWIHNTAIICVVVAYDKKYDLTGIILLAICCIYTHLLCTLIRNKRAGSKFLYIISFVIILHLILGIISLARLITDITSVARAESHTSPRLYCFFFYFLLIFDIFYIYPGACKLCQFMSTQQE